MSYKSHSLPLSGTGLSGAGEPLAETVGRAWMSAPGILEDRDLRDMKFLRSWLVYDSNVGAGLRPGHINWNMVLGLALATAVSASFWAGVGLVIARLWN
jgi:hypothetical protein